MKNNLTLVDYQALVQKLATERGFMDETVSEVFGLLVEEVGELAKAIRKSNGQLVGAHSKQHEVSHEAADVFWLLLDICNRLDIDLAQAFAEKEAINQTRNWQPAKIN
jgi:NTP pyrophosphatase (non-canonical NTP hydrolase)